MRGHVVMASLFQDEPDEDSGPELFQNEPEERPPGLFQDEPAEKETGPPLKKVQETVMDLMDSTCYKMNPTNVGFHNIRSLGLRMMKLKIAPYQIPVLLRTWGRMRRTMICIRSCS